MKLSLRGNICETARQQAAVATIVPNYRKDAKNTANQTHDFIAFGVVCEEDAYLKTIQLIRITGAAE
ncbi:MAG: hypothetical protein FWF10_00505 [Clostridiales bacterium]|nr:hypothetical protein [Clostridiales bacterium]